MSTNINLKNSTDTTFSITHSDGANTKVLDSKDIAVAVDTIADFPANPNNGDVVIVRDLDRGGTFIYDSSEVANSNDGTNFDGWVRQYSGAVNVKWFGAKGDGVTDDTVAIQNAINDNIDLVISDSVYIVSNLVITEKDNFKLSGTGTLKLKNNANTPVIKCTNCTNFIIDGLSFDGNKTNQTYNDNRNDYAGISIYGASTLNYQIINNYVSNNMAGASILVITSASGNTNGYIANNRIYDAGLSPYLSDGMFVDSGWTTVENNEINGTTDYGIAGDYSEKLIIRNNKIYNTFVGIGVLGANFWNVSDNIIDTSGIGIAVTLSGNSPVEPYLSFDVLIENNIITNITRAISGTPNGDGITIDPSASRVSIIGNNINTAFRGIGCSALNVICTNNNVYNTIDKGIFCSGAGSIIANNKSISTAGNYYGSMLDKTIIDTSVAERTDFTSFLGAWRNYGTPFENAGYYKNDGRVYLYGVVKGGTIALGQPFLMLPAGYRPLYTCRFIVPNGYDLTPTILQIDSDGYLIYLAGGGTQVHLYQISFVAQQ